MDTGVSSINASSWSTAARSLSVISPAVCAGTCKPPVSACLAVSSPVCRGKRSTRPTYQSHRLSFARQEIVREPCNSEIGRAVRTISPACTRMIGPSGKTTTESQTRCTPATDASLPCTCSSSVGFFQSASPLAPSSASEVRVAETSTLRSYVPLQSPPPPASNAASDDTHQAGLTNCLFTRTAEPSQSSPVCGWQFLRRRWSL